MSFNFFGFGRKRRTVRRTRRTRKVRRTTRKVSANKPSRTLLSLCKKYRVKTTIGRTRRHKKSGVLKKQCARKIRALIKKHKKMHFGKRKSSFGAKRRRGRPSTRGRARMPVRKPTLRSRALARLRGVGGYMRANPGKTAAMSAAALYAGRVGVAGMRGRKSRGFMNSARGAVTSDFRSGKTAAMRLRRAPMERMPSVSMSEFGKRRRRYRFGSGGNPSLASSMGYEFCSNGGGVLGANSTGLFPSPCMGGSSGPSMMFASPMAAPSAAFGRRRYRKRSTVRRKVRRVGRPRKVRRSTKVRRTRRRVGRPRKVRRVVRRRRVRRM